MYKDFGSCGGDNFVIHTSRRYEDGLDEVVKAINMQAVMSGFYEQITKILPACASILPMQAAVMICCV